MITKKVTIHNADGLHTRPASIFVREAGKFASEIHLTRDDMTINGKSIMGLLMLALGPGSEVELTIEGADETEAMESLSALLSGSFQ